MKIAHLMPVYLPVVGGAQTCVHNVAERHAREGHFPVVVVPAQFRPKGPFAYRIHQLAPLTQTGLLRFPAVGRSWLLKQLGWLQRKYQFDLWQLTVGYPFGPYAIEFFRKQRIPAVLRCSGDDIQIMPEMDYGVRRKGAVDKLIRKTYPLFNAAVAISKDVETELLALGMPQENISIIPNGIDSNLFGAPVNKSELRKKLSLDVDRIVILTAGRFHPKKNYESIPPMLRKILDQKIDVQWVLVGPGNERIGEAARKLGVENHLIIRTVHPSQNAQHPSQSLINHYHAADFFIFPSRIETFGMVVLEAMAAGLPVVARAVAGVKDLVKDGNTGFLSVSNGWEEMAEKAILLCRDSGIRQEMGKRAKKASEAYDWGNISAKYLDLYGKTIKTVFGEKSRA